MNIEMKTGFATIVGRPNVGKSTLLNRIIGQKIAIATNKPQTTRKQIKGIYTDNIGQIVFVDTPGIIKSIDKMGEFLLSQAQNSFSDCDVIVFVVDSTQAAGKTDLFIFEKIQKTKKPFIVVFNKCDLISDELIEKNRQTYVDIFKSDFEAVYVSSKNGNNINILIQKIFEKLPFGSLIYDKDEITDETMRSVAAEIVREKILLNTKEEIPHSVMVVVDKYLEYDNIDKIYITIFVDQNSQKGILIGKNGSMIKNIGKSARLELEEICDKKVFLDLNVKVEKNWKKNKKFIEKYM